MTGRDPVREAEVQEDKRRFLEAIEAGWEQHLEDRDDPPFKGSPEQGLDQVFKNE